MEHNNTALRINNYSKNNLDILVSNLSSIKEMIKKNIL